MGKAINWVMKDDIQQSAGSLQTATGLKARVDVTNHSMQLIFEDSF